MKSREKMVVIVVTVTEEAPPSNSSSRCNVQNHIGASYHQTCVQDFNVENMNNSLMEARSPEALVHTYNVEDMN